MGNVPLQQAPSVLSRCAGEAAVQCRCVTEGVWSRCEASAPHADSRCAEFSVDWEPQQFDHKTSLPDFGSDALVLRRFSKEQGDGVQAGGERATKPRQQLGDDPPEDPEEIVYHFNVDEFDADMLGSLQPEHACREPDVSDQSLAELRLAIKTNSELPDQGCLVQTSSEIAQRISSRRDTCDTCETPPPPPEREAQDLNPENTSLAPEIQHLVQLELDVQQESVHKDKLDGLEERLELCSQKLEQLRDQGAEKEPEQLRDQVAEREPEHLRDQSSEREPEQPVDKQALQLSAQISQEQDDCLRPKDEHQEHDEGQHDQEKCQRQPQQQQEEPQPPLAPPSPAQSLQHEKLHDTINDSAPVQQDVAPFVPLLPPSFEYTPDVNDLSTLQEPTQGIVRFDSTIVGDSSNSVPLVTFRVPSTQALMEHDQQAEFRSHVYIPEQSFMEDLSGFPAMSDLGLPEISRDNTSCTSDADSERLRQRFAALPVQLPGAAAHEPPSFACTDAPMLPRTPKSCVASRGLHGRFASAPVGMPGASAHEPPDFKTDSDKVQSFRAVVIAGFQSAELNVMYVERPDPTFRIGDRETYWSVTNKHFMFYCVRTGTWAIEKAKRFQKVVDGKASGIVHSPQGLEIWSNVKREGWWEWDAKSSQWMARFGAGIKRHGWARPSG